MKDLDIITNNLYTIDYFNYDNENKIEANETIAKNQINTYGWNIVFESWFDFLKEKCDTTDKVISFINLFFIYCECKYKIPDFYSFMGYIEYRLDLNPEKYNCADIVDTISFELQNTCGIKKNIYLNYPRYSTENDSLIIEAVNRYKGKFTNEL